MDKTSDSYAHETKPIVVDVPMTKEPSTENFGVTLEFLEYTPQALRLIITNNSGYNIKYGSGYEITGNQWGYAGVWDDDYYDLSTGEQREIYILIQDLRPGEFQLTKNIIIEPDNPGAAKTYSLYAKFAIENTAIPPDEQGITMIMEPDFTAPVGATIEITNGFESGRIYFDKSYWLQRNTDGLWQDLPEIGSNNFPHNTRSLASRQVLPLKIYWAWLYGELTPGEYRIGKNFLYRTDDGEDSQYDLYATFTIDGKSIPDQIIRDDGSSWLHPFSGITTFRAEVTELIDSDHRVSDGDIGLLVNSLTPFWEAGKIGDPFYIWDNLTVAVLDSNDEQIGFTDIPQDVIVDITFSGPVLTTLPGQIGGALLIQIV